VFDLASASEGEVLKAWQGLGYYSRARNLHATAKKVAYEMGGAFPQTAAEMKTLKGVGDYTAAAIASFCYNECVPVLDGNVQRVVSRVLAMEAPVDKPPGRTAINKVLQEWIDPQNPALFNQAIMEFGALQCTPQKPNCEICPVHADCLAFAEGRQTDFPMKASKTKVTDLWMYYIAAVHDGSVLVRHRQHSGIWKGLYDFPSIDSDVALDETKALLQWCSERESAMKVILHSAPIELLHVLSHRRIHAVFLEVRLPKKIVAGECEQWLPIDELEGLSVSRLVDRYIHEHGQVLHGME
jgi:A/G-specific adenine glycosylase